MAVTLKAILPKARARKDVTTINITVKTFEYNTERSAAIYTLNSKPTSIDRYIDWSGTESEMLYNCSS